jgi:hypothetical protein
MFNLNSILPLLCLLLLLGGLTGNSCNNGCNNGCANDGLFGAGSCTCGN